jgi:predicted NBD/HSP70 family sugar kinase
VGAAAYVIGVDVGGHQVRAVVADLRGEVVAADDAAIDPAEGGTDALAVIFGLLDGLLSDEDRRRRLRAIAVGVTGLVGADGRVALSYALPAWNSADIAGRIAARYGCEVVLDNDARMASMAEHHLGASKLADNVVYLQIGHRISSSLLVDGRVHRGRHHASGEAGYLLFPDIPTDEASNLIWTNADSAEEIVTRSLKGDAAATDELMRFIDALAPGVAALSLVTDPDLIVLGGGISRAGGTVIQALQAAVNSHIRVPAQPTIVQSRFGAEAVVVGGVLRAFELSAPLVYGEDDVPPPALALETILLPPVLRAPRVGSDPVPPSTHHSPL